jgi:hypothetical protein
MGGAKSAYNAVARWPALSRPIWQQRRFECARDCLLALAGADSIADHHDPLTRLR